MSKFSRIVVLVTALASLFAVMSSTAGAVTWTNTGGTSFHGTGIPGTLSVTGSGGTNNLSCADSTATGTVAMDFVSVTGTLTYTSCSLSGIQSHIGCHYTLTPLSQTATIPAVTTGSVDVTCVASLTAGTPLCHIEGTTPAHYVNPNGATPGSVTLTPSSTLRITHSNGTSSCSALLGTFSSGIGHVSEQTITLTGPAGGNPVIVRDA